MKFIVAAKKSEHGILLVITDKEIIGKKFEQGKLQLDLASVFYKGEEKDEQEVKIMIPTARHLHLTGKNAVRLAENLWLIKKEKILIVKDIPHAEVFMGE